MGSKTKNIKDIKVGDVFEVKNSLGLSTEWCVLDVYHNDALDGMTILAQPTLQCMSFVKEKRKLFKPTDISKIID